MNLPHLWLCQSCAYFPVRKWHPFQDFAEKFPCFTHLKIKMAGWSMTRDRIKKVFKCLYSVSNWKIFWLPQADNESGTHQTHPGNFQNIMLRFRLSVMAVGLVATCAWKTYVVSRSIFSLRCSLVSQGNSQLWFGVSSQASKKHTERHTRSWKNPLSFQTTSPSLPSAVLGLKKHFKGGLLHEWFVLVTIFDDGMQLVP